jgi:hypothetical protein
MRIRRDIRKCTENDAWSHGTPTCGIVHFGNQRSTCPSLQPTAPSHFPQRPRRYTHILVPLPPPQITRFLQFFSWLLAAICVRPNSCNQKPPHHLSFVNASMPSSGHVSISISTSRPSSMRRDILPWIQKTTTHAIYMPRRCFELARLTQLCISLTSHSRCGVVAVWRSKQSAALPWGGIDKRERHWKSVYRTRAMHRRVRFLNYVPLLFASFKCVCDLASMAMRSARPFPEEAALRCRSGTEALRGNLPEKASLSFRQALALDPMLWEAFEGLCAMGSL